MAKLKSPQDMHGAILRNLKAATGQDFDEWKSAIEKQNLGRDGAEAWLKAQGVSGGRASAIVAMAFGLPEWATKSGDDLVDGQYAGPKAALRPIYERILEAARAAGEVNIEPRQTYTTLSTPRRQLAIVQATTRSRVDLGLRLPPDTPPQGRLAPSKGLGNETINLRFGLTSPDEVDDEVAAWIRRAVDHNA